jgi:hypothetical protein
MNSIVESELSPEVLAEVLEAHKSGELCPLAVSCPGCSQRRNQAEMGKILTWVFVVQVLLTLLRII